MRVLQRASVCAGIDERPGRNSGKGSTYVYYFAINNLRLPATPIYFSSKNQKKKEKGSSELEFIDFKAFLGDAGNLIRSLPAAHTSRVSALNELIMNLLNSLLVCIL